MMKTILVLSMAGLLSAQETRREIVNAAPTPEGDSKPNSDKVPDVYAVKGQFDRILVLRFKYNTDMLAGIEKIVKQEKIRNAVVLSGAGSVRGYQIHQVSNRDFPFQEHVREESHRARRRDQHERLHHQRQDSRAHDDGYAG